MYFYLQHDPLQIVILHAWKDHHKHCVYFFYFLNLLCCYRYFSLSGFICFNVLKCI